MYRDYAMSHNVRRRTSWYLRPTKTQIRLRFRAVWLESSLTEYRNFASLAIWNAPSKDFNQNARKGLLIRNICLAPMSEGMGFFFFFFFFFLFFVVVFWVFFSRRAPYIYTCKVNKITQELVQSHSHQAPNTKWKDRQIHKAATKWTDGKQNWQLFPRRWELCYPNLTEYIINLHKN